MSNIKQFDYEGHNITFEFADGNKMVNATEMIKAFPEKRINNFLRTQQTQDYMLLLESRYAKKRIAENQPVKEVLRVVKGGVEQQGTWMDEKLALKFAAWLSPEFELWVYDRIHELLTTGKTELKNISAMPVVDALRAIADQLEQQQEFNQEVRNQFERVGEQLSELEAKITSTDENYYTIAGYCALHRIPCPLDKAKEWGKAATALSRQEGVATGTAHDERYGKVRTYHQEVLKRVLG